MDRVTDIFTLDKLLGTGAYGSVHLATTKRALKGVPQGTRVAVKLINAETIDKHTLSKMYREVNILRRLSSYGQCSPNIVCYYDSLDAMYEGDEHFVIVMEYIEGLDLFDYLQGAREPLTYKEIVGLFALLANIVREIHSKNIVHLDIKPENIMLDMRSGTLKLIDFGFACYAQPMVANGCTMDIQGTNIYMSPEIVGFNDRSKRRPMRDNQDVLLLKEADVWALGMVFYMILYDEPAYYRYGKDQSTLYKIISSDVPVPLPGDDESDLAIIIRAMLEKDYRQRATIEEVSDALEELLVKTQSRRTK